MKINAFARDRNMKELICVYAYAHIHTHKKRFKFDGFVTAFNDNNSIETCTMYITREREKKTPNATNQAAPICCVRPALPSVQLEKYVLR